MSDTIRQQLMAAIKTRFEAILIAGGYNFNLGSNVFEWRSTPLESVNLPALVFRDVSKSNGYEGTEEWHVNNLNIEVDIIAAEDVTTPADIRKMIGDVYKAIGVDETWGNVAARTKLPKNKIEAIQKENIIGNVKIYFTIVCACSVWDAYTNL